MEYNPRSGNITELNEIQIVDVCGTENEQLWNDMIHTYHYLGLGKIIGPRIKYLAVCEGKAIAAIGFNRASKAIGVRENYIGWDLQQRHELLKNIVDNTRFLILPWIKIKNLASNLLSKSEKMLRRDWERRYGEKPCVLETFVDGSKYRGTCYYAANWQYLGETRGFGKIGKTYVYHGRKKKVFIRVLDRHFIERIKKESTRKEVIYPTLPINERRAYKMLLGQMEWSPTLLKEAGITESGVKKLGKEFINYTMCFSPSFARSEGLENFLMYEKGLLSGLERKSVEPIALHFAGPEKVRSLQIFMGANRAVNDELLHKQYCERLSRLISEGDGMLCIDGSDFAKKGNKSVGVARQHCGALGKVENCQAGVFIGYSSSIGYGLVDRRLYMPISWFQEDSEKKRKECHVPEEITFKTKIELASEMLSDTVSAGMFKAKWVGVDSFFGRNKVFLDSLPDDMLYFADIMNNMKVFPLGELAERLGSGPVDVLSIAADECVQWNRIILAEGSKGPIVADEKVFRIMEDRNGMPGEEIWLYIRRFSDNKLKFALCNAPVDMPINEIRRAATMRWPIEQCFEECKSELGMDHYEGRSWLLWHRHMLFVFIAQLFLLEVRLNLKKNTNINIVNGPYSC